MIKRALIITTCTFLALSLLFSKPIYTSLAYKAVWVPPEPLRTPIGLLVLDLDGDGIELTTFNSRSIYMNYDSGDRSNLSGWVGPDDGILVRDLNGDGDITNPREFFPSKPYVDGFEYLAGHTFMHFLFLGDRTIDQDDDIYSSLLIWQDKNGNGFTEKGELNNLEDMNIKSISTAAGLLWNKVIEGNKVRYASYFHLKDGSKRSIADVWFQIDPYFTIHTWEYELDERAKALPNLAGYGRLENLNLAVTLDDDPDDPGNLYLIHSNLYEELNLKSLLIDWKNYDSQVDKLMLRWAHAEDVDPKSRGPHIDARQLVFYEQYRGEDFRQTGFFEKNYGFKFLGLINPLRYAAHDIKEIYAYLKTYYTVHISMQKLGAEIYKAPTYKKYGGFQGDLSITPEGIALVREVARTAENPEEVWMRFVQIIAYSKELANVTDKEKQAIDTAIHSSAKEIKSWQEAIDLTEKTYGKIIQDSSDWNE